MYMIAIINRKVSWEKKNKEENVSLELRWYTLIVANKASDFLALKEIMQIMQQFLPKYDYIWSNLETLRKQFFEP